MDNKIRRFFLLAGLILAGLYIVYLCKQIPIMNANEQMRQLEGQIRELQQENERLEIELARYTGLEHIDAQAVRLGMIRPQNVRFILKNDIIEEIY
jgi:cell division protein FtsL